MKKFSAILLCACLALSAAGCGNTKSDSGASGSNAGTPANGSSIDVPGEGGSGFPIVTDGTSLTIMVRDIPAVEAWEKCTAIQHYEEMTGVNIEWIEIPYDSFSTTLTQVMASGDDLPDIIMKSGTSAVKLNQWGRDGLLIDIAPYIDRYMPNLKALMEKYPEVKRGVYNPDGQVFSLPEIVEGASYIVNKKAYWRKDWLDKLGKKMPTTLDEFEDVLRAIKTGDPNGNGQKDEIGVSISMDDLMCYLYGAFGLQNRGNQLGQYDVDPKTGDIRFVRANDSYREMLTYIAKLYKEGLVDQEVYDYTASRLASRLNNDQTGFYVHTAFDSVADENKSKWEAQTNTIKGAEFDFWANARNNLHSVGNFFITSACKNPEIALRWVDYFYSTEGSMLYHNGIEGVDWEVKADGSYGYTDDCLKRREEASSADEWKAQFSMWGWGMNPALMSADLEWVSECEELPTQAAEALIDKIPEVVWAPIQFTEEENDIISEYEGDIKKYMTTMSTKVILGQIELTDDAWNQYIKTINDMGGAKVLECYKQALIRAGYDF